MSKPQHLNYCRQMKRQMLDVLESPNIAQDVRDRSMEAIALASQCQKFMLPYGGMLIDDLEMRALEGLETLSLPHQSIAIEYHADLSNEGVGESAPKRIVFAVDAGEVIVVKVAVCFAANGVWQVYPWIALNKSLDEIQRKNGSFRFSFRQFERENYDGFEMNDYRDEVTVLYGLINALSCSNVRAQKSVAKVAAKTKAALPFDDYHVLFVETSARDASGGFLAHSQHRSPREHLRRGHIRRLADGRRLWVNATVVNAGIGGKVSKDYAIERGRP